MNPQTINLLCIGGVIIMLISQIITSTRYQRKIRRMQQNSLDGLLLKQDQHTLHSIKAQIVWIPPTKQTTAEIATITLDNLAYLVSQEPSLRAAINNKTAWLSLLEAKPHTESQTTHRKPNHMTTNPIAAANLCNAINQASRIAIHNPGDYETIRNQLLETYGYQIKIIHPQNQERRKHHEPKQHQPQPKPHPMANKRSQTRNGDPMV